MLSMHKMQIIQISILPFGMVNCHLVIGDQGCILVDTGLPGSEQKIARALHKHRLTFRDIKLIVVTHAHVDHAGSAARLRELSGAPILAHEADADYYNQKKKMRFCATGWFGRLFLKTGLILQPYAGFVPNILLKNDERFDLRAFGISGIVKHSAGHTAGSISVQLKTGDAMVGDLIASGILLGGIARKNTPMRPPFEDDPHAVADELQSLIASGAQKFYMGHGGPLNLCEVDAHAISLRLLAANPLAASKR